MPTNELAEYASSNVSFEFVSSQVTHTVQYSRLLSIKKSKQVFIKIFKVQFINIPTVLHS